MKYPIRRLYILNTSVVNLPLQTIILAVVLASFAFRMKGNFKVHVITIAVPSAIGVILAPSAAVLSLGDSAYVHTLTSPIMHLATFVSHITLGSVTIAFGLALSERLIMDRAITTRSNLLARITPILFVVTYLVGIWFFVVLHVL